MISKDEETRANAKLTRQVHQMIPFVSEVTTYHE
jgi:hypothetical protein